MSLCSNRFEGFGPHSSIHPNLPTACFFDVIVVPAATWLFIAIVLVVLAATFRRTGYNLRTSGKGTARRRLGQRLLAGLYGLLIVAMLAMISLEIARLSIAQLGIGLLPFNYVGVLLALVVHILSKTPQPEPGRSLEQFRSRRNGVLRFCNLLFWLLLLVAMVLKTIALKTEENRGFVRTGTQAKYPVDDSFVDNLTMVCVEAVLWFLEIVSL